MSEDSYAYVRLADPLGWKRAEQWLAWAKRKCAEWEKLSWWKRHFSYSFGPYDYKTLKEQSKMTVPQVYAILRNSKSK